MRIILATGNRNKVAELSELLAGAEIEVAPDGFDPDETGDTLYQNALIKAEALRAMPEGRDALVLADDSGLCVHALDGRPGVYSARYAGPGATYADNCSLLLKEMNGADDRRAVFACALVGVAPDGRRFVGLGVCPGEITSEPRGSGGFGYDPGVSAVLRTAHNGGDVARRKTPDLASGPGGTPPVGAAPSRTARVTATPPLRARTWQDPSVPRSHGQWSALSGPKALLPA